ncbi:acyltransferase family protein [Bradyrhizobium sp. HKCCYLR20261]|uniref:acyltransferase family protein n=1 Tax=Bradyrhizobium sp. HKCCYLR20261 TaxID=3420760 RepID=UPI003EBDFFDA
MTEILEINGLHEAPTAAASATAGSSALGATLANAQIGTSALLPSLDGIRAVSVLIVVLGHSGLQAIIPGGFGVTIFFFLSGFLITTLMLAEHERHGALDIPRFYARRAFRLMPPLLLSLAIAYALTAAGALDGGITAKGLAAQILYFANYYGLFFDPGNTVPDGTGILWSLAVEEHFYIVYPLLMTLLLGAALRPRAIGALLGLICLGVLAWRFHLVHSPGFFSDRTYYASDTRIDSIAYGCILALLLNPAGQRSPSGPMSAPQWALLGGAAAALLISLVYRDPVFRETLRYSLQGLALMPVFYFAVRFAQSPLFRPLNRTWVMTLGTYSYAIYLIHNVVIRAIEKNAPGIAGKPYLLFPLALLVSVLYAAALERLIEPHFRKLRQQFRPPLAAPAAASISTQTAGDSFSLARARPSIGNVPQPANAAGLRK